MPPSIDFDDELIAGVIGLAARELSARASMQGITVLIAWPYRCDQIELSGSGWCELGRLSDPAGRFWWLILWHPERAEGRLLRYFSKPKRGSLGEVLQYD